MASAAERRSTRLSVVLPNGSSTVSTIGRLMRPSTAKRAKSTLSKRSKVRSPSNFMSSLSPSPSLRKSPRRRRVRLAHDREHVEREEACGASEGLGRAIGEQHRIAGRRREVGMDPGGVEQRAQVVVLREEAVEAVLDGKLLAERAHRPGRQLAAELRRALHERDVEVTCRQLGGGGQPGEAATDDDHAPLAGRLARTAAVAVGERQRRLARLHREEAGAEPEGARSEHVAARFDKTPAVQRALIFPTFSTAFPARVGKLFRDGIERRHVSDKWQRLLGSRAAGRWLTRQKSTRCARGAAATSRSTTPATSRSLRTGRTRHRST